MYIFPEDIRRELEALPVPIAYYQQDDNDVIPLLVTEGLCQLMHLDRDALIDMLKTAMFEKVHPDDSGMLWNTAARFARGESTYDVLYRARYDESEEYRVFHTIGSRQTMADGTELAVLTYTDITTAAEEAQHIDTDFMRTHLDHFFSDPVTRLHNGNYFHEFADEKVLRYRYAGRQPALVYIDVDSMRSYNNQYGFTEGDALLRLVAEELKSCFPDALIVRLADDKFALITDFTDNASLKRMIEGVDQAICSRATGNTTGIRAGICLYEDDMKTADALDHARHAFRQIGSDLNILCNFYSRDMEEQYWNERYIIENFDTALEEGWIQIHYQALMRTCTGKIAALEALARWNDPVRGLIGPNVFIPILEKHHQLYRLDLYMVEQVCMEIPRRKKVGLPLVPVSVNFSAQDFDHVNVVEEMNRIIDRYDIGQYDLTRHDFIVEITEQDLSLASDRFQEQLHQLRESGYRMWVDDFGSGYSALNVFSQYDFDLIKFDLELLRHLNDNNGANRLIMEVITEMCNELGVLALAEGVEDDEQMEFLLSIGCELAQGFHLYMPESLDSIRQRLDNGDDVMICETREERHRMLEDWNRRRLETVRLRNKNKS